MKSNDSNGPRPDLLDRSISALRDAPLPEGPDARTTADTLAALRKAAGEDRVPKSPARPVGFVHRVIAMTFAQKFAAAVLFTVAGVVLWFMYSLTSSISYAQVAERLRSLHSMTCTMSTVVPGQTKPFEAKMMMADPGRIRTEGPGAMVFIQDRGTGRSLVLDTAAKTATVMTLSEHSYAPATGGDVVAEFKKLADQRGTPIEDRQIGGVTAKGFRVVVEGHATSIWADPKSGVPLQVEMTVPLGDASGVVTIRDIVFDAKLDDSLFSLEPPQGYQVRTQQISFSPNVDANVVTVLKAYAAACDGQFPKSLSDPAIIAKITQVDADGKPSADFMKAASSVGALTGLLFSYEKGKEYDYIPGPKLGEADKVVFWHHDKRSGKIQRRLRRSKCEGSEGD